MSAKWTVWTAGLLALLAACGGSDGGADALGDFHELTVNGTQGASRTSISSHGSAFLAGDGSVAGTRFLNRDGILETQGLGDWQWDFAAGWRYSSAAGFAEPLFVGYAGGFAGNEAVAIGGTTAGLGVLQPFPGVCVLVRKQAGANNASLAGTYHCASWIFASGDANVSAFQDLVFDGAGGYTSLAGTSNVDGVSQIFLGFADVYQVTADGGVTIGSMQHGGLSLGGELLAYGAFHTPGGRPLLNVCLRAAATATTSTLSGTYHAVGLRRDGTGAVFVSYTGTLEADGSGNMTLSAELNRQGTIAEAFVVSLYGVASDGTLTTTRGRGAVSPSGDFAVEVWDAPNDPALFIYVRR